MTWMLNFVYLLTLLICLPWLLWRAIRSGKYREGFQEKLLGRAPRRVGGSPCAWFHAVSVGEVLLLKPLVAELARRRPDWDIVISTTTAAGLGVARQAFPELITFYAPLDFSWATKKAIARVKPTALILVELEIWPNLIAAAKRSGARVAVINGRLSARSHRGYRRLGALLRPTLRRIDAVASQTEEYSARFLDLGIPAERITTTGSVKYDGLESDRGNPRTRELRAALGLSGADLVFVAGSTMEGEEAAALAAYRNAREQHPRLRFVVVPRHPHRFDEVAQMLERAGERIWRRSNPGTSPPPEGAILLIDTLGELSAVWGLADIAFVGGSLFPGRGGQNMMEPAGYGASVLFGPYTENFKRPVELLLQAGAARRIRSAAELGAALLEDLDDPEQAAERGESARVLVQSQQGATLRTFAVLDPLMHPPADTDRSRPSPSRPRRGGRFSSEPIESRVAAPGRLRQTTPIP